MSAPETNSELERMAEEAADRFLEEYLPEPVAPAWTRSVTEEVLGTLYLIAGILAHTAGNGWLAWACFAKAILCTVFSIRYALSEIK